MRSLALLRQEASTTGCGSGERRTAGARADLLPFEGGRMYQLGSLIGQPNLPTAARSTGGQLIAVSADGVQFLWRTLPSMSQERTARLSAAPGLFESRFLDALSVFIRRFRRLLFVSVMVGGIWLGIDRVLGAERPSEQRPSRR